MHVSRERVRKTVKCESSLVRDDARLFGPEPSDDELIVFTRREVDQPVDPVPSSSDAASAYVLEQKL